MNPEVDNFAAVTQKPALVMGGSGFVGSHIARLLAERGRAVRVMLRPTSDTRALEGVTCERVNGDVSDVASLRAAMRGCGTVFYCVVDTRAWLTDPAPLYRTNVEGLRNALDAALDEGVGRFVFTSSIATTGRRKAGAVSEADAFNWWDVAPDYIRSRVEAENLLLEYCRERQFPGIALCVANTYGPRDYQPTPHGQLLWQAATGNGMAMGCSAPTVDIRDAAEAALLAERFGRAGERYIVASDFLSQRDLYTMAAAELGKKPPRTLSMKLLYAMAAVNEFFARLTGRKDFKLRRDSLFLAEVFGPLDNSKIIDELGWQPRPIAQTVHDAVAWFSAHNSPKRISEQVTV